MEAGAFTSFLLTLTRDFPKVRRIKITIEADPERADRFISGFSNRRYEQVVVCVELAKVNKRRRYYEKRDYTLQRITDYGAEHKELWFIRSIDL